MRSLLRLVRSLFIAVNLFARPRGMLGGVVLAACVFSACALSPEAANLIELREVTPRRLEVGDRMRITGRGFPEGRVAELTLRGELLQSGVEKRTGFVLRETAKLVAPHAVEVAITAALAEKLCGPAPRHTTFRGDLELVFFPETTRGSRVSGRLSGVVLDISPEALHDNARSLEDDARRYAAFLGVTLVTGPSGLRVDTVEPKSRAFRSGMAAGDQVLELAGVVVRSATDFVPPPNARATELKLWRGNEALTLRVDSTGFRYSAPETLVWAAALVAALGFGFAGVGTALGRNLAFFENRVAARIRQLTLRLGSKSKSSALLGLAVQTLPEGIGVHLVVLGAAATTTALVLGKSVVAAELDLVVLPAVTAVALLLTLLFTGAGARRWSLWRGLAAAGTAVMANLPLLALWLAAGMHTRALRAEDALSEQGLLPFQWAAFREPILGLLALACLVGQVPSLRDREALLQGQSTRRQRLIDLAALAHMLSVLGVVSLLTLGGYGQDLDRVSLSVRALAVIAALCKLFALWALVGGLRWLLSNVDWRGLRKAWITRWLVPAACLVGLRAATGALARHSTYGVLQQLAGPVCFTVFTAAIVYLGIRIVGRVKEPPQAATQPWL
ncbi:MAG TPA: hypothetical protein VFQ61_13740 [Polyangiaceae bacterium]|nr:hypothetical protein [Polyangiaceae bacterium]